MRNYAEMSKGICGYNFAYNFFVYLLPLKTSVFLWWTFQTHYGMGRRHFQNVVLSLK